MCHNQISYLQPVHSSWTMLCAPSFNSFRSRSIMRRISTRKYLYSTTMVFINVLKPLIILFRRYITRSVFYEADKMVFQKNRKNSLKIAEDGDKLESQATPTGNDKKDQGTSANRRKRESGAANADDDYVAPDGGWGWMVALGLVVVFVTTIGPAASFTLVFGDFLNSTGAAGSIATILNTLSNVSYSLASLITSTLLKHFSMRSIGLIGAILFAIPNVILAYVQHVVEVAVIFFLQGIGLGLIFTICNTNFNTYFDRKRTMVMGISQAIVGAGGIVYPILIEFMMEEYGFAGTLMILGALSLNCIPAMALMRPPAIWKAKLRSEKSPVDDKQREESKSLLAETTCLQPGPLREIPKRNKEWNSTRSLQQDDATTTTSEASQMTAQMRVASVSEVEAGVARERSMSLLPSGRPDWSKSRKSSLLASFTPSSLTNIRVQPGAENLNQAVFETAAIALARDDKDSQRADGIDSKNKTPVPKIKNLILDSLMDFSLLRDRAFLNTCMGMSFVTTSDWTFVGFLPMIMTSRGFTKADASLAITVSASAELASRICLAVFTIFVDARPKTIYFGAMIVMMFAKAGYLYLEDTLTGTIVMMVVIGFARSWLLVPQPLAVVQDIRVEKIAAAYGVCGIVGGVISVILGPLAGFIKDWTDSFTVCQVALLVMNGIFIVPWAIEMAMDTRAGRR